MQRFLIKWRPQEEISFEFANTCSNPSIGEFGGGTIVVMANDVFSCTGVCVTIPALRAISNDLDGVKMFDMAKYICQACKKELANLTIKEGKLYCGCGNLLSQRKAWCYFE